MAEFDPIKNYGERINDPGAPYYYKARVPVYGNNPIRNSLLGKAIALNVRYPFHLVKSWGQLIGNIKKPSGASHPYSWDGVGPMPFTPTPKVTHFQQTPTHVSQPPAKEDLHQTIKIILADEYSVYENGGEPYLKLDFIPKELAFDVKSTLKNIGVIGINYPHYHFQGSQEVISFTIDWYDYPQHKHRVITKCKMLEALSKADGFTSGPAEIMIDWDGSKMFKGNTYLVESANYKVRDFLKYRSTRLGNNSGSSTIYHTNMNPIHATQKVVLKRIASHLTSRQIIYGTL